MATHGLFSTAGRVSTPLAIAVLLVCRGWSAEPGQYASSSDSATPSLVREALEKEVAGDNRQRESLLRQALDRSPKDPAPHWQLKQVRLHDKWQSPADVERASCHDKPLAEYSKRRDAAGLNVDDQVALARWCRKNQLNQQQRIHWLLVLQLDPGNADALKALGMRPFHGTLATPSQIDQLRAQMHRVAKATDRWRPRIGQWLGTIQRGDALLPQDLRDRICVISDSGEMLGLERGLWLEAGAKNKKQELHRMVLAIALALADNPYPAGAEALARSAAFSEYTDVRSAAISGLKKHPLDHYVPLLLSGLQSPIEADMQCMLSATGDLITALFRLPGGGAEQCLGFAAACPRRHSRRLFR